MLPNMAYQMYLFRPLRPNKNYKNKNKPKTFNNTLMAVTGHRGEPDKMVYECILQYPCSAGFLTT